MKTKAVCSFALAAVCLVGAGCGREEVVEDSAFPVRALKPLPGMRLANLHVEGMV